MVSMISVSGDPRDVEFDPNDSALLVVDMQGAFLDTTDEATTFANTGLGIDSSKGGVEHVLPIVPNVGKLVEAYRRKQLKIVHLAEQYDSFDNVPWRWQQGAIGDPQTRQLKHLQAGSEEAKLRKIPPMEGETFFPKNGKNAFKVLHVRNGIAEPVLTHILRDQLQVRHLIFTGVATSVCVGTTAMSATEENFDSILVADACGDFFPDRHERTLQMFGLGRMQQSDLYGSVIHSTDELIKALEKS